MKTQEPKTNHEELENLRQQYGALHCAFVASGQYTNQAGKLNTEESQRLKELVTQHWIKETRKSPDRILPAIIDRQKVLIKAEIVSSENYVIAIFPFETPLRQVNYLTHQLAYDLGKSSLTEEKPSESNHASNLNVLEGGWQAKFIEDFFKEERENERYSSQDLINNQPALSLSPKDLFSVSNFSSGTKDQNSQTNAYVFREIRQTKL